MQTIRLLIEPPAGGAWNMAVDEALLDTAVRDGLATLRFYEWREPTLSLGYFQSAADRSQHAASGACPLVRRASGGGAIVHDRELTYSIAMPQHRALDRRAGELVDALHETLVAALNEVGVAAEMQPNPVVRSLREPNSARGASGPQSKAPAADEPFLCFQRLTKGDIVIGKAKIAGSAQRRRRGAVLQHGSVLLARSLAAPELPGIAELADIELAAAGLAARWADRVAERFAMALDRGGLREEEKSKARTYALEKYGSAEYGERR